VVALVCAGVGCRQRRLPSEETPAPDNEYLEYRHIRLIHFVRSSQTDHNMAIVAGQDAAAVDELIDELGGEREIVPDELLRMLTALLERTKVIAVEDAASQIGKTAEEVEECGRRNASLVGFAGGNKRVLFRVVEWQPAAGNGRE